MKSIITVLMFLAMATSGYAITADDFIIGCYTYMKAWQANSAVNDSLRNYMEDAGFNLAMWETNDPSTNYSSTLINSLHNSGIDSYLCDYYWNYDEDPAAITSGTHAISTGNNWRFEAEYDDLQNMNENDDMYFYKFAHPSRVGEHTLYNVRDTWKCDPDLGGDSPQNGIALAGLKTRWKSYGHGLDNSIPISNERDIGPDFRFAAWGTDARTRQYLSTNKLYLRYCYKVDSDYSGPESALTFKCAFKDGSDNWIYVPIKNTMSTSTAADSLIYTYSDLLSGSLTAIENPNAVDNFRTITFEIDMTYLYDNGFISTGAYWFSYLYGIDPYVYWHGNGTVHLDYLDVYDTTYDMIKNQQTTVRGWLENRDYSGAYRYYTLDEPYPPQFDSLARLNSEILTGLNTSKAISTINWRDGLMKKGSSDERFSSPLLYLELTNPDELLVDYYPLEPEFNWNIPSSLDVGYESSVQWNLDWKMLKHYYDIKMKIKDTQRRTLLYVVPCTSGRWSNTANSWDYYQYPTPEMAKCLQLLPLCYGVAGVIDYQLMNPWPNYRMPELIDPTVTERSIDMQWHALLEVNNYSNSNFEIHERVPYNTITEANKKLKVYGPLTKNMEWIDAATIGTDGLFQPQNIYSSQSSLLNNINHLDSLKVRVNDNDEGSYQGYVQCGFFKEANDNPWYMLVNRRTNFVQDGGTLKSKSVGSIDNYYCHWAAAPQSVIFVPNQAAHSLFGTHVGLYDLYDNSLFVPDNDKVLVDIDPGDGRLLQMCSTLPALVTNNTDIKNIAYLSGSITIDQGAEVTIHPGTETKIFANSTIMVTGGSTLNISGIVDIADSVSIIVESGSNVLFNDATCNWGVDSYLQIDDSGITATNTILQNATTGNTWRGLRITNADTIDMTNTTITGARSNEVTNSQVQLTDCRFNIPNCGFGLTITNSLPNHSVRITSTVNNKGFYSTASNSIGLIYENPNASLFLSGMIFDGLSLGFIGGFSSADGDTIQYCGFSNNITGMLIAGLQYSPLISNCTFSQNDMGAYFEVSSPKVMDCSFLSCDVGIRTELATSTAGGIYNSIFSSGEIGIVSRGSNQRVTDNKFYTNTGILNHAGSILNMGNTANNLFKAEHANLKFQDTASYTARVQLYEGHNDFYHKNPGLPVPSTDFHFDSNWYASPPPRSNAILANYNWFEDGVMKVFCPGTPSHYVYCNNYNPSPNVYLENNDRMAQALSAELAGNYLAANDTYKMILDENEISEAELLFDAMDAYYRTADLAGVTNTGAEAYLLAKIDQYETDNSILAKYLEDYLIKYYLQAESFQAAIDLLELRILNTECPIDSLHAVMDLEIVLQLAAMSESKKPINTKFTQYKYPDRNIFIAKHEENWELLDELLNGTKDEPIPIPDKPLISSNYPNPFNPSTTIAYSVPKDGLVRIGIYNIKGQKVKELCNSEMQRGHHKIVWDGKDANQRNVSSGVYFVKLQASGAFSTRKIMLMK